MPRATSPTSVEVHGEPGPNHWEHPLTSIPCVACCDVLPGSKMQKTARRAHKQHNVRTRNGSLERTPRHPHKAFTALHHLTALMESCSQPQKEELASSIPSFVWHRRGPTLSTRPLCPPNQMTKRSSNLSCVWPQPTRPIPLGSGPCVVPCFEEVPLACQLCHSNTQLLELCLKVGAWGRHTWNC